MISRWIEPSIRTDLDEKIVLLTGPRQVGKTTVAQQLGLEHVYLNYDAVQDRRLIQAQEWDRDVDLVIFDELHKMKRWKSWIKGIYDTQGTRPRLLVTGSARLDTYKKGGDSLAGRHFLYRLHPFTVRELATLLPVEDVFARLLELGGFPEPFLKHSAVYARRWRRSHLDTILREDLIDLERVRDIKAIETLIELLRTRVGSTTSYANLASDLGVAINTVKNWLQILHSLYVIFPVTPYHRNVARSLLKESKYYFYDTGVVEGGPGQESTGSRLENAVAVCLLGELQRYEDVTGNRVALHFLRDKDKREVDFATLVDGKVTHLIEVKHAADHFDKNMFHFRRFFPEADCHQLVQQLDRKRSKDGVRMQTPAEFLSKLRF